LLSQLIIYQEIGSVCDFCSIWEARAERGGIDTETDARTSSPRLANKGIGGYSALPIAV